MSYIKDKTIIDFLCQVESLIQSINTNFEPIYYIILGYTWQSNLQNPKSLASIVETFSMLHQYEEFQAISQSQRNKLFLDLLIDPRTNLEQRIYVLTSEEQEERKEDEQSAISKNHRLECLGLYEKVELQLVEHLALTEEDARLLPIDLILWGFFIAHLKSRKVGTNVVFEKLLTIRQAEISSILNHNQKMRVFIKLYNDWELDLNNSFAKLLENPTLGSKPLDSLIIPEDKMNEVILQQLALEEKIEQEKARQEREKQDNEGISCNICLLDLYDKDEDIYFMELCVHNYHESCLTDYLKCQVKARKFPVECPDQRCKAEFTAADLKELMTEEDVEKYYEAALDEFIKKNGKNMSYCPSPGCPYAFVVYPKETDFECPVCFKDYCLKCMEKKHEGQCAAKDFLEYAKNQNYKACPQCKFWVEKTVGCHNMTCRCGFHFCYACGKSLKNHGQCDYSKSIYYENLKSQLNTSKAIQEYLFDNRSERIPDYNGENLEYFHNDNFKRRAQKASLKIKAKKNKKKSK